MTFGIYWNTATPQARKDARRHRALIRLELQLCRKINATRDLYVIRQLSPRLDAVRRELYGQA